MKIRFENTIDDIIAFNHYHCEHSPLVRRVRARVRLNIALVSIGVAVVAAYATGNYSILAGGAAAAAWFAWTVKFWFQRSMDRQARKLLTEGVNKSVICVHELELIGDDLIERTPFNESRSRLAVVERVVTDGAYTFIYVSAMSAHVIPHDAVTEGDPVAFADALKKKIDPGSV